MSENTLNSIVLSLYCIVIYAYNQGKFPLQIYDFLISEYQSFYL